MRFLFFLAVLFTATLSAQCPVSVAGPLTLFTQADVNDFGANFPNCQTFIGDLNIGNPVQTPNGSNITDLTPLNNLQEVQGNLSIPRNPDLASLIGLDQLTTVTGEFSIALNSISDFQGLENLNSVGGRFIVGNNNLTSFSGLSSLTSIGGEMVIVSEPSMTSSQGLTSLTQIGGLRLISLRIANLDGFSNLQTIAGDIFLGSLANCTNIDGLTGINPSQITNLEITDNDLLTACSIASFCTYLNQGGAATITSNNGASAPGGATFGCRSVNEILETCFPSPLTATISGNITDVFGNPVEGVTVGLIDAGFFIPRNTNQSGNYLFTDVELGEDYTVTITSDQDCLHCINIEDLMLLSSFLDGAVTLSPFQLIAADVTGDQQVTIADLDALEFFVSNGFFPNELSVDCYTFIAAGHEFLSATDPWQPAFPEVVNLNNLNGDEVANFAAIPMGDLTGCTSPPASTCPEINAVLQRNSIDECCYLLTHQNISDDLVYAIDIHLLNGASFETPLVANLPGYVITNQGLQRVTIHRNGQPFDPERTDLLDFCLTDITSIPQRFTIEYWDDVYEPICLDSFELECAIENYCLEVVPETPALTCTEDGGYRLQMDFVKPEGDIDEVGLIKVNITSPDVVQAPLRFMLDVGLQAGDVFSIDTVLALDPSLALDSLCIFVTAHDGPEERQCCFGDALCLEIPVCDPCSLIDAYVEVDAMDSCCYYLVIDNQFPVPGYLDSIILDTVPGNWFAEAISSEFWPNSNWVGFDNLAGQSGFANQIGDPINPGRDTVLYFCLDDRRFATDSSLIWLDFYSGDEVVCQDTVAVFCAPTFSCDSLATTLVPQEDNSCCYDVIFTNSAPEGSSPVDRLTLAIGEGPTDAFSQVVTFPPPAGYTVTENSALREYTYTHAAGALPMTPGTKLMEICAEEAFSTDSTLVTIDYLASDDTLCTDTAAIFCPGCLTIVEEELFCDQDAYLYHFSFTNNSDFPVNAYRILDSDPNDGDNYATGSVIRLPVTVEVGDTYAGFLPVNFTDDNSDGAFCFDLNLRYITLENEIGISCCYATHCIELPDCESAPNWTCQSGEFVIDIGECGLLVDPVCGCNGTTYDNLCYANEAGVAFFTGGACPNTPPVVVGWNESATIQSGSVVVSAPILEADELPFVMEYPIFSGWRAFIIERFRQNDATWWPVAGIQFSGGDQVVLTDENPLPGMQLYRLRGVSINGQPYISEDLVIEVPTSAARLTAFPNPVRQTLHLSSDLSGPANLTVSSLTGLRNVVSEVVMNEMGVDVLVKNLPPGVYFVQLKYPDGTILTQRFVKD